MDFFLSNEFLIGFFSAVMGSCTAHYMDRWKDVKSRRLNLYNSFTDICVLLRLRREAVQRSIDASQPVLLRRLDSIPAFDHDEKTSYLTRRVDVEFMKYPEISATPYENRGYSWLSHIGQVELMEEFLRLDVAYEVLSKRVVIANLSNQDSASKASGNCKMIIDNIFDDGETVYTMAESYIKNSIDLEVKLDVLKRERFLETFGFLKTLGTRYENWCNGW